MGFPNNPVPGELHTNARGNTFEYVAKGDSGVWRAIAGTSVVGFSVGPTPPANPIVGDYWHDTIQGLLKLWQRDEVTESWTLVGSEPYIGITAPENPLPGMIWYNTDELNLYFYIIVDGTPSWKLIASASLDSTNLVISKVFPLSNEYNDERISFELFVPNLDFSFRNIQRRSVEEGLQNDDTLDIDSTIGINSGEEYVIFTEADGLLDEVRINSKLSGQRLKLASILSNSYGVSGGYQDAYFARTSVNIPEDGRAIWRDGDIFFSKNLNTLERWPDGEVAIRRTATGSGQFAVYYRKPDSTVWLSAGFPTSVSVDASWRDELFKIPTTGIITLKITYESDNDATEETTHIALFCAAQNNDTGRVEKPVNVTPAENATSVLATPTLTGSDFNSIYGLDQGGAEFQVALDANFSNLVVNTSSDYVASWIAQAGQSAAFTDIINFGEAEKKFIAVADSGVVTISIDGGKSWTPQTFGVATNIKGIACNDTDSMIAVGASGMIRLSSNNGGAWTGATAAASYSGTFNAVALKSTNAVAVGTAGEIQRSVTTGAIWTHITQPNSYAGDYNDVCMDGTGRAIAVGTVGEIITSGDFGLTWTKRTPAAAFNGTFHAVADNGLGIAIAVGASGMVQRTTDYGASWQQINLPGAPSTQFNEVAFVGDIVVIVGNGGVIYSSDDKGVTFILRPAGSGSTANFTAIAMDSANYGVIVGAGGAVQYTLRLEGVFGTSFTVPAGTDMLEIGKVYWWRCRYQDEKGFWSDWSDATAFATASTFAYIVQPQNLSPANDATNIPILATLQSSSFSYVGTIDTHVATQWEVASDASFGTIVYSSGDKPNLTSFTLPAGNGMVDKGVYYWRCRHKGSSGNYSSWSVPTKFTAQNNPGAPAILSPTEGATNVSVTPTITSSGFSSTAPGETHFKSRWQISQVANFATIVHDSGDSSSLTSYNVPAGFLDPLVQYYVRVRHIGVNTGISSWSTPVSFTTTRPATPSITAPTNNATGQSLQPTFTSSAFSSTISGEAHIASQWQVSTTSDFASLLSNVESASALVSHVYPGALSTQTAYYVRVRHKGDQSGWSGWSTASKFTTGLAAAPSLTSPAAGSTGNSLRPTLISSAFSSPTAESHVASQWQISTVSNFATTVVNSGEVTNLTSYNVATALAANTQYYARVRHKGSVSGWSNYSTAISFTTGTASTPTLTSPTGSVSNQPLNPLLQSSSFSSPTSGETHSASQWQISSNNTFTAVVMDSGQVGNLTSYQAGLVLSESTTYYARVRHLGSLSGWSDWSAAATFSTGRPATPAMTAPTHGSTGQVVRPTLSSTAFSTPISGDTHTRSRWQISTTSNMSSIVVDSGETTSLLNYTPGVDLDYVDTYYVRVAHKGTRGGWSNWSAVTSFTTKAAAGSATYSTPGTYVFTVPAGVTSVNAVVVGGGGGGGLMGNGTNSGGESIGFQGSSGGGGGLRYMNSISVTPGQSLSVVVGAGGNANTNGGSSSFAGLITAFGGVGGHTPIYTEGNWVWPDGQTSAGGSGSGGAGGNGGTGGAGGGGAGGYSGNGGSSTSTPTAGSGGGGGGGYNPFLNTTASGGGVGLTGPGSNGAAGSSGSVQGKGGSGGAAGSLSAGGQYGGGGGAGVRGGHGGVRISWS